MGMDEEREVKTVSFGENLKRIRTEKGITQTELAKKAVLDQSTIARFEQGRKQPTLPTAKAIADALECKFSELVE